MPYRYLEHTADVGIEARGDTLEVALAAVADGLAGWLCDASSVTPRERRVFEVRAADLESMVVDWLNEVNFEFEVGRFAFSRFEVEKVEGSSMQAVGLGEPLDPSRHHPGEQVKSVTYHGVKVERAAGVWTVRVYLDI